ncbi:nuclear factor 7, ovary isoform X1 [Gymnodraco acuticeps]|uniref:Nuclear factor 7, ovary isoform X1 n=1 Tax=Gymnodraco acuticeps TaxID=8218 RepID=A0A6P8UAA3_GYMAC|nr:nuclear factor 7, ovary isoform X1 [Gymnodraco acuticeps]
MAGKEALSVGDGQLAQSGLAAPAAGSPAGSHSALQEGRGFSPLDSSSDRVQPFPRSPKLQKKIANFGQPSKVNLSMDQLSRRVEELQAERTRTEAHIQSLKKRKADLSKSTEVMKQRVQEHFENMHCVLKQDEQAVQDSLELDLRQARTRLDQVLKTWQLHQDQVTKSISSMQRALSNSPLADKDDKGQPENLSPKKPDVTEKEIRLNEERFKRLLKTLSSISKQLKAQLQRKTLLLDSSPMVIDRQTCHSQITVTLEGRGLSFSGSACSGPAHPLQFDKVCCALDSAPVTAGQRYSEVDVRCCSAWALGVAYASMERKGRDKGSKLGRNRNSWCLELRNGNLSAWHNDRHVACKGVGQTPLGKVGIWLNYDKGQLLFYDADTMAVLQRFSAAVTPVFDRAHHHFTQPVYLAVRFLRPPENQMWPNHLELCPHSTA